MSARGVEGHSDDRLWLYMYKKWSIMINDYTGAMVVCPVPLSNIGTVNMYIELFYGSGIPICESILCLIVDPFDIATKDQMLSHHQLL